MKDVRNTVDVIYDHKTPKTLKICNNKNWFVYYSIYIQLDFQKLVYGKHCFDQASPVEILYIILILLVYFAIYIHRLEISQFHLLEETGKIIS